MLRMLKSIARNRIVSTIGLAIVTLGGSVSVLMLFVYSCGWVISNQLGEHWPIEKRFYGGRTPPQWTPDGAQIMFSHSGGIYVIDSDGTGLRRIHGGDGENDIYDSPNISPDGSRIVYLKYHRDWWFWEDYRWEVATSALNGTRERVITNLDRYIGHIDSPSWSPDGRHIAFVSLGMIYTMSEDGSDLQLIPGLEGQLSSSQEYTSIYDYPSIYSLVWSPDGRRIAFITVARDDQSGEPSAAMYMIGIDGSSLKKFGAVSRPAWSPDGTRMAFAKLSRLGEDNVAYFERLYTMRPDGSDLRDIVPLPEGLHFNRTVSWSPDGSEILAGPFLASMDGSPLRLMPWPDGAPRFVDGDEAQVGLLADKYSLTSWSPDGSRIAIQTTYDSAYRSKLYTVGRDGSDSKVLVTGDAILSAADGRPLFHGQTVTTIYPDGS